LPLKNSARKNGSVIQFIFEKENPTPLGVSFSTTPVMRSRRKLSITGVFFCPDKRLRLIQSIRYKYDTKQSIDIQAQYPTIFSYFC
jgi:hypothetical protein